MANHVPNTWFSGEDPFPGLQVAAVLLNLRVVSPLYLRTVRTWTSVLLFFGSTLIVSFFIITSLKILSLKIQLVMLKGKSLVCVHV